jgi:hypothetical protein
MIVVSWFLGILFFIVLLQSIFRRSLYLECLKYFKENNRLFGDKPLLGRWPNTLLIFWDAFSLNLLIQGPKAFIEFRTHKPQPPTAAAIKSYATKIDILVLLCTAFWFIYLIIISNFDISLPAGLVIAFGSYRLIDIFSQRFRSLFIDPFIFSGEPDEGGHVISVSRSFICAILNYFEIVLIYSVYYTLFSYEALEVHLSGINTFYFSLLTITTFGFGHIQPQLCSNAVLAKITIMTEICLGILFVVMVIGSLVTGLSDIASHQYQPKGRNEPEN